jgi:predicted metallopeptidase
MSIFFNNKPKKIVQKKPKKTVKLEWHKDATIQQEMGKIVASLEMSHVIPERVYCYRTTGSKARAYARIWSFPKIFQEALSIESAYVMEIISERYGRLNHEEKTKVIIHELLHIPKNFSGSLLPHKYGHTQIDKEVETLYKRFLESK